MNASRRLFLAGLAVSASAGACSSTPEAAPDAAPAPRTTPAPSTGTGVASPTQAPHQPTSSPHARPRGDLVHGPRSGTAVALTFHGAGPASLCRQALAAVASAHAHITVLAVGSWLHQNAALATAIVEAGHDLGNHTWSHLPMRRLGAAEAHGEIERAAALLERLTGSRGRWFRPSGTPRSTPTIRAAAARSGYERCLAYDVDPLDYTDPGADVVVGRVLGAARPGSIISLHLGHAGTVKALPQILDGLSRRGLRSVSMATLVGGH